MVNHAAEIINYAGKRDNFESNGYNDDECAVDFVHVES